MRSLRLWVGICVLAFTGAAAVAGPRLQSLPHRYAPNSLDGPVVQASVDQTGITWAAWAYRHGAEYDIALSHLDGSGYWSEPTFLGRNDGRNQAEPFLVTDPNGTAYLTFTDFSSGRILLSTRPIWGTEWSEPQAVSAPDVRASAASLLVVRDRMELVPSPAATAVGTLTPIGTSTLFTVPTNGVGIQAASTQSLNDGNGNHYGQTPKPDRDKDKGNDLSNKDNNDNKDNKSNSDNKNKP